MTERTPIVELDGDFSSEDAMPTPWTVARERLTPPNLQLLADAYPPKYGGLFRFEVRDGVLRGEGARTGLAYGVRATNAFGPTRATGRPMRPGRRAGATDATRAPGRPVEHHV